MCFEKRLMCLGYSVSVFFSGATFRSIKQIHSCQSVGSTYIRVNVDWPESWQSKRIRSSNEGRADKERICMPRRWQVSWVRYYISRVRYLIVTLTYHQRRGCLRCSHQDNIIQIIVELCTRRREGVQDCFRTTFVQWWNECSAVPACHRSHASDPCSFAVPWLPYCQWSNVQRRGAVGRLDV